MNRIDRSKEDVWTGVGLRRAKDSPRHKLYVDIGIALLIAAVITALGFAFDVVDRWYDFTRAHETWQLDELPSALLGIVLGLTWVVYRQFARLAALIKGRERERRLRHADKMESLGNLAGGLAHELNNMLLPTLILSQRVKRELPEDDPNHPRLERIIGASERAASLVRQMMAFGQEEAAELEELDLRKTITGLLPVVRASVPSSIELSLDLAEAPCRIYGDAMRIEAVVAQLVKNAVEAIEPNAGSIRLTVQPIELTEREVATNGNLSPGRHVELAVSDSGVGMDPKTIHRIFDPFFTTKAVGMGTGLGLSVVHSFVTGHNGAITVDSAPKRGSTIRVLFPAAA